MGEARQVDRATIEQAFALMGQYLKDIYPTYFADRALPFSAELRFRDLADAIAAKLRSGG